MEEKEGEDGGWSRFGEDTDFNAQYFYGVTLNSYADSNPCGTARILRPRKRAKILV